MRLGFPAFDGGLDGLQEVGRGSTAAVYRATRHEKQREKDYAVKVFDTQMLSGVARDNLANEVSLLAELDHPHIVRFREACLGPRPHTLCVVMDMMEGGTLSDFLRHEAAAGRRLPEPAVWRCFLQLASAVQHLHVRAIIHRDIKPANARFADASHERLVLLDLGLAARLADPTQAQCGTPTYAAPEVFTRQPAGLPSDLWSLGCVLYELCCPGTPAFRALSIRELRAKVVRGEVQPLPEEYSDDLQGVLASLLRVDPAARPTADQLLAHPAVAPRLSLLQAQGLVQEPTRGRTAAPTHREQERSTSLMLSRYSTCGGTAAAEGSSCLPCLSPVASLTDLLEQLPPPRYSRELAGAAAGAAGEQGGGDWEHHPDAFLSELYRPGGSWPASQPATPQQQQQQQAAALQVLQRPSPLAGNGFAADGLPVPAAICVHADATAAAAAAPGAEAQSAMSRQRSRSLPEGAGAEPPAAGAALHPKYAAMVEAARAAEAAGTVRPRTASRSTSPAKAPGSPMPMPMAARRPPLSKTGSGASVGGSSATPRRFAASSAVDVRALDARILEAQRSGGAAALAAAVRASLAEHDEQLLQLASAHLSRLSARSATPRTPASRLGRTLAEDPEGVTVEPQYLGVQRSSSSCPFLTHPAAAAPVQLVEQPRQQEVPRQQAPPKRRWKLVGLLRRRSSQAG